MEKNGEENIDLKPAAEEEDDFLMEMSGGFVEDDNALREKCVVGYYEDEEAIVQMPDRSEYSNWEVNESLGNYFRFFGSKDMDIVYLYFLSRKRQDEIMTILGKSQPAVSYDVTRIRQQIEFVMRMIEAVDDFIMFITDPANPMRTFDKEILVVFFYTTSIVKTARLLKIKNVTCRSHLSTIVNHMQADGYQSMYELFKYIMSNLNNVKKYVDRNCGLPPDEGGD